jgi:radical SAM protein with 4Fe4S-binding SPASM domain
MKKVNYKYFFNDYTLEEKMNLFKKMVRLVEVEVHSHCNRTCWFCPNSYIDRKSKTFYFDEHLYLSLLNDLAKINYDKVISFTRYSEPFSDEIIYKRLKQCNEILPNAVLSINTNGDYLNNNVLKKICDSGLKKLNIQLYLREKEEFNLNIVEKYANSMKKKLTDVLFDKPEIKEDIISYNGYYQELEIKMYARNFKVNGTMRGDINVLSTNKIRTSPCTYVFHDLVIDYNGKVVPCCNIRTDNDKQKDFIFGSLQENTIFDIYFSDSALSWRKNLYNFEEKKGPCSLCTFGLIEPTFENISQVAISSQYNFFKNIEEKDKSLISMKNKLKEKDEALQNMKRKVQEKDEALKILREKNETKK